MDLDKVDYALLSCLRDNGGLWKKKIHEELQARAEEFPGDIDVSSQTVGRRIEKFHEKTYVSTTIINPDDLPRDLIIAYNLTEEGAEMLREKRLDLLKEYSFSDEDIEHRQLLNLLEDHLHLEPEEREFLEESTEIEDLRLLAGIYIFWKQTDLEMEEDSLQPYLDILTGKPYLQERPARN